MAPLAPELRRDLEKAIVRARGLAEAGARASLARLSVEEGSAPDRIGEEQRRLRVALRARSRALGNGALGDGIGRLVEEIAYAQWHRMLFARFLAENALLIHPEGAPVTLAEVRELADEEGEPDHWVLAARYAAAMLPGIFRTDDPANQVAFAPEDRQRLEGELAALPGPLFTADDALGWVYQFWQSQRKDEVNRRGDKIGGADLPPVTQLFTEHYMVRFLLENSLGAWWAGRHPDSPLLAEWDYLRFRDDGTPAAGTFEGWPSRVAEVTVMDPCCGSGHFLVAAADMLRKMRAEEEGLTPAQAAAAVIAENLFGLELDARCLQLAAFNLALDAWKAGGYQPLPIPNLACSGIAIKGQRADWHRLAGDDTNMRDALDRLYDLFQDAPELGSLIDPRAAAGEGLWKVDTDELLERLDGALSREADNDPAAAVFGSAAAGTARAARLLAGRYWLVATNPPFLGSNKMSNRLREWLYPTMPSAKSDLAAALLERCRVFLRPFGTVGSVLPETWFQLRSFAAQRRSLLCDGSLTSCVDLGPGAFGGGGAQVAVGLLLWSGAPASEKRMAFVIDAHGADGPDEKATAIRGAKLVVASPSEIASGPATRITFTLDQKSGVTIGTYFQATEGLSTGDRNRYVRSTWELAMAEAPWRTLAGAAPDEEHLTGGRSEVVYWEDDGRVLEALGAARIQGRTAWGRSGVLVGRVGALRGSVYFGDLFDKSCVALTALRPHSPLAPLMAYVASPQFYTSVRAIDRKTYVTTNIFLEVPFDLEHWTKVAAEKYPNGLPEPQSDDPTQWLFKGNVVGSEAPLQVAVARLLGYRWPDQEPDALDELADPDGLVPLPSAGGDRSAADRLRELLARAYGDAWSPALLERLLTEAGSPGKTLETWLRDDFFAQHVKLFANRPFIWHVWDGRKDGFGVLCHYHRLDRSRLEKLTYTLLGDWIERQREGIGEPGAEVRLAAALDLQKRLGLILVGEAPHDIYVRWKSLAEQSIGWEPDLDDGVRLNIRPFVIADVLRGKVNVKWENDRGKNPDGSDRINDLHPTLAEKRTARAQAGRG